MAQNPRQNISAKAQQSLGLPEGFKTYSPFPFGGINASASDIAIADNEFVWLENFVRLGDGNLRTVWDVGQSIYSGAVVNYAFFTIGTTYYAIVFLSNGNAVQINMATKAQTAITTPLPFYVPASGYLPCVKQWGTQYLLISNRNTPNDYWAWDGSILYQAGTAAPNGVNI
ncbi:MAG: hypothetical protein KGL39_04930, partial [Patescibacteria group bacterium]|nr:hypothetical protein [Patescibacteria group bacterium]